VLGIRTNVVLIAAAAVGYFFFAGLRTFAVEFLRRHFGLSQAEATGLIPLFGIGALAGVILSGRIADRLLSRGRANARIDVPAVCFAAAAVLLLPGLLIGGLALAMIFLVTGGAALAGANPPLDSARLDIVPSALWGRAESVRTVLRELAQAGAPVLFGLTADALGGRHGGGVEGAFLVMLVPLAISAGIVWLGRRSYRADVAAARRDAIASRDS
jgi:predicted MFS family arabinose efflux permease